LLTNHFVAAVTYVTFSGAQSRTECIIGSVMIAVTQRTDPTATAMLRIRPTPMLRQSERRLPEPTSGHGILGIAHADGKELTGAAANSF